MLFLFEQQVSLIGSLVTGVSFMFFGPDKLFTGFSHNYLVQYQLLDRCLTEQQAHLCNFLFINKAC